MGFTAWLALIYLILLIFTTISFLTKKNKIGYALIGVMIIGIIVLGYLWITSPM